MNKKFAEFFMSQGMTVNGNSAYGIVRGYETNAAFVQMNSSAPLQLHISFYSTDEQKRYIEGGLRSAQLKYVQYRFTPYGLAIGLTDLTFNTLAKKLPVLFDTFYGIIAQCGGTTSEHCPVCGELYDNPPPQINNPTVQDGTATAPDTTAQDASAVTQDTVTDNPPPPAAGKKQCFIDGYTMHLHPACVANINAVIEAENKDFANAPNNYLRGFLGALIGGVVGAVIAIVLNLVGFISSIAAVVSVVLGCFLYQKFHGKPNKMMLVIVSITTVVCMVLSVFAIYVVVAGVAAIQEGVNISAMEAFTICMQAPEFARMFYLDLALILVFSAIGIGVQIAAAAKSIKRKGTIK